MPEIHFGGLKKKPKSRKGQKSLPCRSVKDVVRRFSWTTRIDLDKRSPLLVDSDYGALCHTSSHFGARCGMLCVAHPSSSGRSMGAAHRDVSPVKKFPPVLAGEPAMYMVSTSPSGIQAFPEE